jgi:hypothetical protein
VRRPAEGGFRPCVAAGPPLRATVCGCGLRALAQRAASPVTGTPLPTRHLSEVGFDPVYGARPVKRAVQRELETPLAKALLTGQFQEEDTVVVEATGGEAEDGSGPGSWLAFARIPGAQQDEGEPAGPKAAAAAGAPVPVTIPGHTPVRAPAPKTPGGGTGGGASSGGGGGGKFDPLGGGKKGGGAVAKKAGGATAPAASSSGQQQQHQAKGEEEAQQQQSGGGAAANGAAPAGNGAAGGAAAGGSAPAAGGAAAGGVGAEGDGLDEGVASSLFGGGEVPAFLKTPRRRDEQEDAPTCAG